MRNVFAVPLAVPFAPAAVPDSPTRNGTICVFFAALLSPVESAAVVPTSVGVPVRNRRPIPAPMVVESWPRFVPLIMEFAAWPALCVKVLMVNDPELTVTPPLNVLVPVRVCDPVPVLTIDKSTTFAGEVTLPLKA